MNQAWNVDPLVHRTWVALDAPGRPHAHASCLLASDEGLHCAWFAGTREAAKDTVIMTSTRRDGIWSDASPVPGPSGPSWNPVLDFDRNGRLRVMFKVGPDPASWTTWVSLFRGEWTPALPLVADAHDAGGGCGPARTHLLRRGDVLLAPGSDERHRPWTAFVDASFDDGETWSKHDIPPADANVSLIQPSIVEHGSDVLAFLRTDTGHAFRSRSADGLHWSPPEPTDMPNNNSGLDVVALPDGRLAAVHNPSSTDWGARCPLLISVSDDAGITWKPGPTLEDGRTPIGDVAAGGSGADATFDRTLSGRHEYSYPSAVVDRGRLLVSYTWQRRGIALAELPLAGWENHEKSTY